MGKVHNKIETLEKSLKELEGLRVRVNTGIKGLMLETYMEHTLTVKIVNHFLEFHSATQEEYDYLCNQSGVVGNLSRELRKEFDIDFDKLEKIEEIVAGKLENRTQVNFKIYLGSVESFKIEYKEDSVSNVEINGIRISVANYQKHNSRDRLAKEIQK